MSLDLDTIPVRPCCQIVLLSFKAGKSLVLVLGHFILIQCIFSSMRMDLDGNGWGRGQVFMANAETQCPQLVADSRNSLTGNFSSPAWPSPYPPDAICFYRLQGVPWEGIKLTFLDFDLEPPYSNAGCLSDYLELTTIDIHEQRTFRGRYCGRSIPDPILFLDPILELVFRANPSVHHSGFFASYEFIDEAHITPPKLNGTSPCGGVVSGVGGVISSPGYPLGYSAGLDCLWLIRVPYQHAIYLRIHDLEFQGSISNCQKAQIGIYDGYEYALDETSILKRFCGDLRYYKGEEERVFLSTRNRLLIRYTTTEPSKPTFSSSSGSVGFRLIWSDVEFNSVENCTRMSRFPCQESRFCFTKHHVGGAANCPDLRHYCISNQLVCDSIQHCGEGDSSDEQNCYKAPLILLMVALPLTLLFLGLATCFCCQRLRSRNSDGQFSICCLGDCYWNRKKRKKAKKLRSNASSISSSACFTKHDLLYPSYHMDMAPIPRSATPYNKHHPCESPGASDMDIVSPASGFSDSESDMSMIGFHPHPHPHHLPPPSYSFSCPTHGPFRFLAPPSTLPALPVLPEEYDYFYDNNDNDEFVSDTNTCGEDDGDGGDGSTISSQNSDNQTNNNRMNARAGAQSQSHAAAAAHSLRLLRDCDQQFDASKTSSPTDAWRNSQHFGPGSGQRRAYLQRSDALVWSDNDGKSSVGSSSPTSNVNVNVCPRCSCSVDEGSSPAPGPIGPAVDERSKQAQWMKRNRDTGGMSGRLVGVPSLLRKHHSGGGGCNSGGGGMGQFDSGIDTSIENVKVLNSFDSISVDGSVSNVDCGPRWSTTATTSKNDHGDKNKNVPAPEPHSNTCSTVTTFGINSGVVGGVAGGGAGCGAAGIGIGTCQQTSMSKATDV